MEISDLYKKDKYLDKSVDILSNVDLVEYDIKEAGFNIIKKYRLLSDTEITHLELLPKKKRMIRIGVLQKGNRDLKEGLKKGFEESRRLFFEANNIQDQHILSIKKDAIFVLDKTIKETKFNGVVFVPKNHYTSYCYLNRKEFYYSSISNEIHVKGIAIDEEDNLFMEVIKSILLRIEKHDYNNYVKYLLEICRAYLRGEVDKDIYKELSTDNAFRYNIELDSNIPSNIVGLENIEEGMLDHVSTEYNYLTYLVPLLNIAI